MRVVKLYLWLVKVMSIYQVFHRIAMCRRLACPSVCLSVRLSVFTITQEWVDVEWWNFALTYLRSRVTSSLKMGHALELWTGQTGVYTCTYTECIRLRSVHVHRAHSCGILVYNMCYCRFWISKRDMREACCSPAITQILPCRKSENIFTTEWNPFFLDSTQSFRFLRHTCIFIFTNMYVLT